MSVLQFVSDHPIFTFLFTAMVLAFVHDIVLAWKTGGGNGETDE